MSYKIAVSGAAAGKNVQIAKEKARLLGREIAKQGCILTTGATSGLPDEVSRGAKKAGGIVIGFSPAASKKEHVKKYKLPLKHMDVIVYTGFDYSGRNLLLSRSSDANIIIGGRMGTLNEFTIAFEDHKLIGVLIGSGGISDEIRHIINVCRRGPGKIIYDSDPKELVKKIINELKKEG